MNLTLLGVSLSKWSQAVLVRIYCISECIAEIETDVENKCMDTKGVGGIKWELGIDI